MQDDAFFSSSRSPSAAGTLSAQVLSVAALNRLARETLEHSIPLLWVGGEISNLTRAASGHLYFTLKDDQAQVRCAMWRNRAQLLAFRPENGMRVEARALKLLEGGTAHHGRCVERGLHHVFFQRRGRFFGGKNHLLTRAPASV